MAAPLQYLDTLREAQPELSESCNTLADLYQRQLWDQLTLKLEQFIALPIFQAGDALIHLYHNFITEFELKINLLKLAHFAVIVSARYAEKEAAISYLNGVIEKLCKTKEIRIEQPILYVKMRIGLLKLEQGNKKECKELIDEGKSTLDSMTDIEPSVCAEYDRVSSQYYKRGNDNAPLGQKEDDVDEMMTLSEIQMLAKNKLNQGRKKLKEKSTLAEIMDNLRGKEKDKVGKSADQIEEDIGSQKEMGEMEGDYEIVPKRKILTITKVYQRRTKLNDKGKPFSLKEKEKESDMEEEEKIDEKKDTEKKREEKEHEDVGGQETLAEMQMLAKKKLNEGRKKLKQGKEKEQEHVEEVNLEKENGLEEEIVSVARTSGNELLDVSSKKQMDEKEGEGEEVTLAEMKTSAKKLNQEKTNLKCKDKNTSVKKKQQDKDDEQKDEGEGSCEQKGIEEQDGEEDKENEMQELPAVRIRRKRERYSIPEVCSPEIGERTREKRDKRKTSKLESLYVLERSDVMAKDIEMEEEMAIVNLRKKRARRKPDESCSFEVIESASNSLNSDGETIRTSLEIVSVSDFDFYDFNKDRIGRKFQKGQVWAIYDDKDGMPRHYAVIDEVVSVNPFQVQLNWLDSRENTVLPIACGSFKVSISVMIKSGKIFSHIADFERAAREVYKIYPKKGSVWAMLNNDGMDIVVFLTSYSEIYGLSMAYLERVNGFKTIYKRREIGAHAIKFLEGNDFRLLSHHIPARKLSGEEVSGLPKHCWELDPASLPESLAIGWGR